MTLNEDQTAYFLKKLVVNNSSQSILLQNQNGPCALIAIANVLVLRDGPMAAFLSEHSSVGQIDEEPLLAKLGDSVSTETSVSEVESIFEFLPKMSKGLDVNPKFDGSFLQSPELDVFRAFKIKLVHGWVLGDLESEECEVKPEDINSFSQLSYEQVCEAQFSDQPNHSMTKFIEKYPTQMSPTGLIKLQSSLEPGELAVLFWNNHFSTIVRHNDEIFSLVIDLGFQESPSVVWEQLSLRGAGRFLNGDFNISTEEQHTDEVPKARDVPVNTTRKQPSAKQTAQSNPHIKNRKQPKRGSASKTKSKCLIA